MMIAAAMPAGLFLLAAVAVAVLVAFVVFVGLGVASFLTLLLVWR